MGIKKNIQIGLLVFMIAISVVGCATTSSVRATALKPTTGTNVDLSKYQIATVVPFDTAPEKKIDPSIGVKFSEDIATRLQNDFGPLFQEVRKGASIGKEDELIVTGTIKTYKPGSKFGRAMLIGVGAASFEGDLILKDATDNHVLLIAPFDKLWAWGGALGMSKDIDDMVSESAAAVASTVAQAKGWKPSLVSSKSK